MLYLFTDHGGRLNTNRENRPCSLCEKDFKFTQPMREYCQHCSIDARRIASKPYRIFDRDWFSIDGRRMDGAAAAASASSAASKVLIARLCIEDELKRQHRPPSPLPSPPGRKPTGGTGGHGARFCSCSHAPSRMGQAGPWWPGCGPQQAYVVVLAQLFTMSFMSE